MISFTVSSFGQDLSEGLKAKNDGNEAYKKQDYVGAIANYEKYLNSGEKGVAEDLNTKNLYVGSFKYAATDFMIKKDYQNALNHYKKFIELCKDKTQKDGKTFHNMGICASKVKANDEALSYFQQSTELGYKEDTNALYIARVFESLGDFAKMEKVLFDAWEKFPESKLRPKMAAMLVVPLMTEASIPFNAANELAKEASVDSTKSDIAPALEKYKQAVPLFEKVLKYDVANVNAKKYLNECNKNIAMLSEKKVSLEKK